MQLVNAVAVLIVLCVLSERTLSSYYAPKTQAYFSPSVTIDGEAARLLVRLSGPLKYCYIVCVNKRSGAKVPITLKKGTKFWVDFDRVTPSHAGVWKIQIFSTAGYSKAYARLEVVKGRDVEVGCSKLKYRHYPCKATYKEAKAMCSSVGMHLASPPPAAHVYEIRKKLGRIGFWVNAVRSTYRAAYTDVNCDKFNFKVDVTVGKRARRARCSCIERGTTKVTALSCDAKGGVLCAKPACDVLYTSKHETSVHVAVNTSVTRDVAQQYCKLRKMKLASIQSMPEMLAMCEPMPGMGLLQVPFWQDYRAAPNRQYKTSCDTPMPQQVQPIFKDDSSLPRSRARCVSLVNDGMRADKCRECYPFICENTVCH